MGEWHTIIRESNYWIEWRISDDPMRYDVRRVDPIPGTDTAHYNAISGLHWTAGALEEVVYQLGLMAGEGRS